MVTDNQSTRPGVRETSSPRCVSTGIGFQLWPQCQQQCLRLASCWLQFLLPSLPWSLLFLWARFHSLPFSSGSFQHVPLCFRGFCIHPRVSDNALTHNMVPKIKMQMDMVTCGSIVPNHLSHIGECSHCGSMTASDFTWAAALFTHSFIQQMKLRAFIMPVTVCLWRKRVWIYMS
jgi:hypothetical protein